jgi:hypothetical protein
MQSEKTANDYLSAQAAERARWLAVLSPKKPVNKSNPVTR